MSSKDLLIQLRIEHDFDSELLDKEWKDYETYRELLFNGTDLASIKFRLESHYERDYISMIEELSTFKELVDNMVSEVKSVLGLEAMYVYPRAIYARLFIIRVKALKEDASPVKYRIYKTAS